MIDALISAAGPAPARTDDACWRQVALLALAASLADADDDGGRHDLVAALCALDLPHAALAAVRTPATPWQRWWSVLAAGQVSPAGLAERVEDAARVPDRGADGRDVRRRLADLSDELAALAGEAVDDARFGLVGSAAGPPRRAFLVGRSSATFVVDPSWEGLRLVRLGPGEGPRGGNRAHHTLAEIIELVRRGDQGAQRDVPADDPRTLDPARMIAGLQTGSGVRERQLLDLAEDVRAERAELSAQRTKLEAQRAKLRHALDEVTALRAREQAGVDVPTTRAEAAALLDVHHTAGEAEVERAYKQQITRCHPDRVAGLHPDLRAKAEALTVAVNAARDVMGGLASPARRR